MIVDSSVWIAELHGQRSRAVERLKSAIVQQDVLVGDLILLEVLQGARDERHARLLQNAMAMFPVVDMMSQTLAVQAARNFRILRTRGFTVRKTVDLIIGTYCILTDQPLLQQDRDFTPMAEHLGLRLA